MCEARHSNIASGRSYSRRKLHQVISIKYKSYITIIIHQYYHCFAAQVEMEDVSNSDTEIEEVEAKKKDAPKLDENWEVSN